VYGRSSEQTASVFSFGATLVGFTGVYPYDGREAVHSTGSENLLRISTGVEDLRRSYWMTGKPEVIGSCLGLLIEAGANSLFGWQPEIPALGRRKSWRVFAEHLLNNRLQMRYGGATGRVRTPTKQTKIDQCERVRVN
jgi:hypothetical protein